MHWWRHGNTIGVSLGDIFGIARLSLGERFAFGPVSTRSILDKSEPKKNQHYHSDKTQCWQVSFFGVGFDFRPNMVCSGILNFQLPCQHKPHAHEK